MATRNQMWYLMLRMKMGAFERHRRADAAPLACPTDSACRVIRSRGWREAYVAEEFATRAVHSRRLAAGMCRRCARMRRWFREDQTGRTVGIKPARPDRPRIGRAGFAECRATANAARCEREGAVSESRRENR